MSKKLYYISCEIEKNEIIKHINSEYFTSKKETRQVLKDIKKNDCIKFYYLESVFKSEVEKYSYSQLHGKLYKQVENIKEYIKS